MAELDPKLSVNKIVICGPASAYRIHRANRFGMYELQERNLEEIDYSMMFEMWGSLIEITDCHTRTNQ